MGIKHNFVSAKADGADTTKVRPSTWNEDHIVSSTDLITNLNADLLDGYHESAFAILAGRATPQTLAFGNAASAATGYLTSTSHATKGKYFLNSAGTITVDELNVRLGIGTANPTSIVDVVGTDAINFNIANPNTDSTIVFFRDSDETVDKADIRVTFADFYGDMNFLIQAFSDTATYGPTLSLYRSRGKSSARAALQSGDLIGQIGALGRQTSQWAADTATIKFLATETFTNTAAGTKIQFSIIPNTTEVSVVSLVLDQDKSVQIPNDNASLIFGAGLDAKIYYDGADLIVLPDVVGTGRFVIDTSTLIGQEAVMIKQDDQDQAFINFQGTSAGDLTKNISTFTTEGGTVGYVKMEINGVAYWFRSCTAPTL